MCFFVVFGLSPKNPAQALLSSTGVWTPPNAGIKHSPDWASSLANNEASSTLLHSPIDIAQLTAVAVSFALLSIV